MSNNPKISVVFSTRKIDKTFKSGDDAMKFMIAVAKKYKKELQMDDGDTNESSKLTSMIKK